MKKEQKEALDSIVAQAQKMGLYDVREDDVEKLAFECFQNQDKWTWLEFKDIFLLGYNKAKENTYTEEQVMKIAKFTISQWTSLNEQREYDHKDLVDVWLDNDLCNFIQSLKQPKK